MTLLATLALAVVATLAPDDPTTSAVTVQDVATAALALAATLPDVGRFEYGGAVVECPGTTSARATVPVTSRSTHHVAYTVRIPVSCRVVALYHTHPAGHRSAEFSPNDVTTARALGVPSYIGLADGSVRVLGVDARVARAYSKSESATGTPGVALP